MNLECPKCGFKWDFEGTGGLRKRVQCRKCKQFFNLKQPIPAKKPDNTSQIHDDIMHGNIMDALDKADIDPMNHNELIKDAIPIILKEDKLKYAFAKACSEKKNSPEKMIRVILKNWLMENKYYE